MRRDQLPIVETLRKGCCERRVSAPLKVAVVAIDVVASLQAKVRLRLRAASRQADPRGVLLRGVKEHTATVRG